MSAAPCKDCEDRHINCHAECSFYKSWRSDLDSLNAHVYGIKSREVELVRRRNDAIAKGRKRSKR